MANPNLVRASSKCIVFNPIGLIEVKVIPTLLLSHIPSPSRPFQASDKRPQADEPSDNKRLKLHDMEKCSEADISGPVNPSHGGKHPELIRSSKVHM